MGFKQQVIWGDETSVEGFDLRIHGHGHWEGTRSLNPSQTVVNYSPVTRTTGSRLGSYAIHETLMSIDILGYYRISHKCDRCNRWMHCQIRLSPGYNTTVGSYGENCAHTDCWSRRCKYAEIDVARCVIQSSIGEMWNLQDADHVPKNGGSFPLLSHCSIWASFCKPLSFTGFLQDRIPKKN